MPYSVEELNMDMNSVLHFWILIVLVCGISLETQGHDERYIGCFIDKKHDRIFSEESQLISNQTTIELCIDHCNNSNVVYAYAGVEFSSECYCGVANVNYLRHGEGNESDCRYPCSGDNSIFCGGSGFIAVFNLSVTLPISMKTTRLSISLTTATETPTVGTTLSQQTIQEETTISTSPSPANAAIRIDSTTLATMPTSLLSTHIDVRSTMTSMTSSIRGDTNNVALYAGAGGGAFLLIIIIIPVSCVACRRRNSKNKRESCPPASHELIPVDAGNGCSEEGYVYMANVKKDQSSTNTDDISPYGIAVDEKEEHFYENKGAEQGHDNQNTTELDKHEYVNLPEAMNDKETSYMNTQNKPSLDQATPNPAALYAMPDLSAKIALRPMTYTPPDKADGPSLLYAMPDRRAKTVYSSNREPSSEEDNLDTLYTTSTKNRLEPIGMEASGDEKDLYALPDKKQRDYVIQNGAGKRDAVEAMYAMPDKSCGGKGVDDNTIMIENEIYSYT